MYYISHKKIIRRDVDERLVMCEGGAEDLEHFIREVSVI